jgi:hypothetical protein
MSTSTSVRFIDLVDAVASRRGLDLDLGQVEGPEVRALAEQINTALKLAWEYYPWAQLIYTLKVVLNGISIVPHAQFDWRVLGVWSVDPDLPENAGLLDHYELDWLRCPDGIYLPSVPAEAWVRYRPAVPVMSGREWDVTKAYKTGQAVYLASTGHCYRAGYDAPAGDVVTTPYWYFTVPTAAINAGGVLQVGGSITLDGVETTFTSGDSLAAVLASALGRTVTFEAGPKAYRVYGEEAATGGAMTALPGGAVATVLAFDLLDPVDLTEAAVRAWLVQACPDFLAEAVKAGAEAAGVRTDGQVATSAMIEAAMEGWIEHEILQLTCQEGQQHRGAPVRRG